MKEEKRRWPLEFADLVADMLVARLGPRCKRIQVAGSVRRRKPLVGDVEVLCIPHVEVLTNVLGEPIQQDTLDQEVKDLMGAGLLDYRFSKTGHRIAYGPMNKCLIHVPSGMGVDVFTATEENWGMALVVRTGPAEWNIKVMSRLQRLGMRGHAYGGITDADGKEVRCLDEETVFRYLGWPYLAPEERS